MIGNRFYRMLMLSMVQHCIKQYPQVENQYKQYARDIYGYMYTENILQKRKKTDQDQESP